MMTAVILNFDKTIEAHNISSHVHISTLGSRKMKITGGSPLRGIES